MSIILWSFLNSLMHCLKIFIGALFTGGVELATDVYPLINKKTSGHSAFETRCHSTPEDNVK